MNVELENLKILEEINSKMENLKRVIKYKPPDKTPEVKPERTYKYKYSNNNKFNKNFDKTFKFYNIDINNLRTKNDK